MFAHIPALTFSRSLQFPDGGLFSVALKKKKKVVLLLLLLSTLDTSDPLLPLCLCFTADRGSARAPPARVIYDQQLLL